MVFAAALPAWTDDRGLPLSFRHFVYGMAHIGRAHLLEGLAHAQAIRAANYKAEDFAAHQRDVTFLTEVPIDG